MKKWLIISAVTLALLCLGLVVTYRVVLSTNFLVAQIEKSIDSRVQVGGFRVSPFSVPAKVVITDVLIAERDEQAREGVPHDERKRLENGAIRIKEIAFDLSLRDLFAKQIKVSELKVVGASANLVMNREGELNIASLFAAPPETAKEREKQQGLNAKDSADVVTQLDRLLIVDASFDLEIEKTGMEIEGREVNFDLSDIKVDPNALEKVNEAHLEFGGRFAAFSSKQGRQKYGQIGLDGPARVRLFDPASGDLAPNAEVDLDISVDSYVSAKAPYIIRLWKLTDTLTKFGLTAKPLSEQLPFGRERKLKATYANSRLDLRESVSLLLDTWELELDRGSWVAFGSEQHESGVRLMASDKASQLVDQNLAKLVGSLPEEVRDKLQAEMRAQLFVEDRLTLKAGTQGLLSDPAVKLKTRLPDIEKILKEYATGRALDLLFQKLIK